MIARIAIAFTFLTAVAQAAEPVVLSGSPDAPNGAWCWFQSPRAIVDESVAGRPLLLVGTVSCSPDDPAEHGDLDVLWLDLASGQRGSFELVDCLESDDHDSPSLWRRPSDGRYVAAYTKHCGDRLFRWRVSTEPGDPTSWEPEQTLDALGDTPEGDATYTNLHHLGADRGGAGRLYNLTRAVNWDPTLIVSDDEGATWRAHGVLFRSGGGRDRPYARYASDGERLHVFTTDRHPRQGHTSLLHGVVQDGRLTDLVGRVLDGDLFDDQHVGAGMLSTVFRSGTELDDAPLHRAWPCDAAIGADGSPVVVFSTRAADDPNDHRFLYARVEAGAWSVRPLAHAGAFLYPAEDDYTGLASLDPRDPRVVYVSTPIDPATGAATEHYELYRGQTPDGGRSWTWRAITSDSAVDNLRPLCPERSEGPTVLVWMRGDYVSYREWDTEVVALELAE